MSEQQDLPPATSPTRPESADGGERPTFTRLGTLAEFTLGLVTLGTDDGFMGSNADGSIGP